MIVYRELSSLTHDLGVSAGSLYALSNHLDAHYHKVSLPKKDGGCRTLFVPDPRLKYVQRRILEVLLAPLPLSDASVAYRRGRSLLSGARVHVGKPLVLRLDIRHFFDGILYSAVKDAAFPAERYAEPLRVLLTMLCYYRDRLPQGAPTSPVISNLVMAEFDRTLTAWCEAREITYTRYCDDMTFSGSFDAPSLIAFVRDELQKRGFFLNEQKTVLRSSHSRQSVTGIVVNTRPHLCCETRRALRQELYYCEKFGLADALAYRKRGGQDAALAAADLRPASADLRPVNPDSPTNTDLRPTREEVEQYRLSLLGRIGYALFIDPGDAFLHAAKAKLAHPVGG